jgi:lincosamide nucleotidyltransferase A/C/D/E
MLNAEDVIEIYQLLSKHNIRVWLSGGWGIDALLGEQTRPHKDLDMLMQLNDIVRTCNLLKNLGYDLAYLWPENRQACDGLGAETATAFVLQDPEKHEIDIHALILNEKGNGIPAWEEVDDFIFSKEDLEGKGVVGGCAVQCLTAKMQVRCHQGYEIPEKQLQDLERLYAKFGIR